MKPRRPNYIEKINKLHDQQAALEQQLATLTYAHSSLAFKAKVLSAWCESLSNLKSCNSAYACVPEAYAYSQQLEQLQQEEQVLLQQLACVGESPPAAPQHSIAVLSDPVLWTIAPPEDPMAYFRDLASRPQLPGIESWTILQLAQHHRALTLELGMQLHLLQNQPAMKVAALDRIKPLLDKHFHVLASLIKAGKLDVVESLKTMNLDTLEPLSLDSPLVDNQEGIASTVLPRLELSQQQEDAIACAVELCDVMLAPITEEWMQLRQQIDGYVVSASTTSSSSASSSSSTLSRFRFISSMMPQGSSSPEAAAAPDAAGNQHSKQLEEQQKLTARLKVVMHKQYHILFALMSLFVGSLTWVQAAKICVYRYPYSASLQYVAKAVRQQRDERRSGSQLQQQPQKWWQQQEEKVQHLKGRQVHQAQ